MSLLYWIGIFGYLPGNELFRKIYTSGVCCSGGTAEESKYQRGILDSSGAPYMTGASFSSMTEDSSSGATLLSNRSARLEPFTVWVSL